MIGTDGGDFVGNIVFSPFNSIKNIDFQFFTKNRSFYINLNGKKSVSLPFKNRHWTGGTVKNPKLRDAAGKKYLVGKTVLEMNGFFFFFLLFVQKL